MLSRFSTFGACVLWSLLLLTTSSLAHPAEGQKIRAETPDRLMYEISFEANSQLGEEWNFGDVQLALPLQTPDSLTDLEWYIVNGAETCPFSEYGMAAWYYQIAEYVHQYYTKHGVIPEQFGPEILSMCPGLHHVDPRAADIYRNPFTGEWPRLDAREQSPGDVFVKILTEEEALHFAMLKPNLYAYCNTHIYNHPIHGPTRIKPAHKGVLYIRVYGLQGVIVNMLYYPFTTDENIVLPRN